MAATTTITVPASVRDRLRVLAQEHGRSLVDEIAALVADAEERRWRAGALADFARLQQDPEAWRDYQAELAEWDSFGVRELRGREAG